MRAESLALHNLRNHRETSVRELAPQINVFAGPNGAGKTSILEGIALATLTKSFTTSSDIALLSQGADSLHIDANFVSELSVPIHVQVDLAPGPPLRKSIFVNAERLRSASDLIGRAPVVVLTPDDKIITNGPPAERRRFLNVVLSQASRAYLEHEIEFRRALKQRNSILNDAKQSRRSLSAIKPILEPWTDLVIQHASKVMLRRAKFTEEFKPFLLQAYQLVSESKEEPDVSYQPLGLEVQSLDKLDIQEFLREQLRSLEVDELRRGTSLIGAHRDDLLLSINPGSPARDHASQGQHKTLLVAMKIAEFRYLEEAAGERPIMLLDDVFSELDSMRAARLLELAASGVFGQTLITSTERAIFEQSLEFRNGEHHLFIVENGNVLNATERALS